MLIENVFPTPWGLLTIVFDEHFIYRSYFNDAASPSGLNNSLSQTIKQELASYFSSSQHRFQLPLKPQGTPFQLRVWHALLVIPHGRTLTYGELAHQLQTSPRAIGQACRRNPLALFIPCHRIVGKLNEGGYMGNRNALGYKKALLKHEGNHTY